MKAGYSPLTLARFTLLFCMLIGPLALAQDQPPIFAKPTGYFFVQPNLGSDGMPIPYNPTRGDANWAISQWNIPGQSAPSWIRGYRSQNGNIDVQVIEQNGMPSAVSLSQDGGLLPCFPDPKSEYDLFVGPNWKGFASAFPSAGPSVNTSLDSIPALLMSAELTVTNIWRASSRACGVNQRAIDFSAVFSNSGDQAHPGQTLYYDLAPYATRCDAVASDAICDARINFPAYFYFDGTGDNAYRDDAGKIIHQVFGYDDDFTVYNKPTLVLSQSQSYEIDILPRVKYVIAHGPNGMDTDLSHWRLSGIYYGSHIWGNVGIASEWRNFNVRIQ